MMKRILMAAAMALVGTTAYGGAVVWIEGESALKTNLAGNPWLKGDNPKLLSGGDAFAGLSDTQNKLPKPAFVLWKLDVPEDGTYHLYFRHCYMGHLGQMKYRFVKLGADGKPVKKPAPDEGWTSFDSDAKVMDLQPIGQHRTIEWSKQAPVKLEKGSYYLDLQVLEPASGHLTDQLVWTVFDVICLTTEPFTPSGYTKPGETPAAGGGAQGGGDYY